MSEGSAELLLSCVELEPMLAFLGDIGFALAAIFPADAPREALMQGHGFRLRLIRDGAQVAGLVLRLPGTAKDGQPEPRTAPNGLLVDWQASKPAPAWPAAKPEFSPAREDGWSVGRAGMLYRDLIPSRQGGRVIASHIRIPDGGPVPDYVHYHHIQFQLIYCVRGWVRLVYEDQGEPFVMQAGECVLQPPMIRHRVLESSPGLEVVELACPAEHETHTDPALALPTAGLRPEREFGGQRFVFARLSAATWQPLQEGVQRRELGIGAATGQMAEAGLLRVARNARLVAPPGRQRFWFVLQGRAELVLDGESWTLENGAAGLLPECVECTIIEPLEVLEIVLPATTT